MNLPFAMSVAACFLKEVLKWWRFVQNVRIFSMVIQIALIIFKMADVSIAIGTAPKVTT